MICCRSLRTLDRLDLVGQVGRLHVRGEAEQAFPNAFQAACGVQPYRNSLSRLVVAHTSFHPPSTFSSPRKLNGRKDGDGFSTREGGLENSDRHKSAADPI